MASTTQTLAPSSPPLASLKINNDPQMRHIRKISSSQLFLLGLRASGKALALNSLNEDYELGNGKALHSVYRRRRSLDGTTRDWDLKDWIQ